MAETPIPSAQPVWATTPNVNGLIEPSPAKQALGWVGGGEKPPYQTFNWWQNLVYQWTVFAEEDDQRRFAGQQTIADVTIASGAIDPSTPINRLRTEAAAASDQLASILSTEMDEGRVIVLVRGDSGEAIEVAHGGTISLRDSASVWIDDDQTALMLQNRGGVWKEIARSIPAWRHERPDAIQSSFEIRAGRQLSHFNLTVPTGATVTVGGTLISGDITVESGAVLDVLSGGLVVGLY